MSNVEVGQRVGAIVSKKESTIEMFGYGVYLGDKIPESDNVKMFGVSLKELGHKNPCIQLDSGKKVYGCECWWALQKKIKDIESECDVVTYIDPEEYRKGNVEL